MKSPEFSPRPKAAAQEKKREKKEEQKRDNTEQKIIDSRHTLSRLQEFIDARRIELAATEDETERARITESMREAALEVQRLTDIIESASAALAQETP